MKELMSCAANIALVEVKDGELHEMVEVCVICSEPVYEADASGEVIRRRETYSYRFSADASGLEKFAAKLMKYADDAKELRGIYA